MRPHGFTLLEVLVSMLVLSIGLLGLAGLLATNVRNNHSAYYRSQATWLAYDLIDRIRVNRQNAINGQYNIALAATLPSTATMSGIDLNDWKATLARVLPAGDGSVAVVPVVMVPPIVPSPSATVTVIIRWDDSRGTGGNNLQQFQMDTRL